MSFGLDTVKNREAITALHRDGIIFATNPFENPNNQIGPPRNLAFLEICREFSNKLLKQDTKVVLQFLDRMLIMGRLSPRREWELRILSGALTDDVVAIQVFYGIS
jgi:cohesin complex subunit SA-1/2